MPPTTRGANAPYLAKKRGKLGGKCPLPPKVAPCPTTTGKNGCKISFPLYCQTRGHLPPLLYIYTISPHEMMKGNRTELEPLERENEHGKTG